MFENILGQESVLNLLQNDIQKKSLNNSMIFHGEKYTGKLTTALELARVLNCLENRETDCRCSHCRRINELNFEGLIYLSRRNHISLLNEYLTAYQKSKNSQILKKIIKLIKLTFLPLQEFIIQDVFIENEKKTIFDLAENVNDILLSHELTSVQLEELVKSIGKIYSFYKKPNIPVNAIRNVLNWTYIAHQGINRVVIIDQVDYLEESSRNILLKRLEEPAPNLFFILIAEKRSRIIQTILSRCRSYYFIKLREDVVKSILEEQFEVTSNFSSLSAFIERDNPASRYNLYPMAVKLFNLTLLKEHSFSELNLFLNSISDREKSLSLLKLITSIIDEYIREKELDNPIPEEITVLQNISKFDLTMLNNNIIDKLKRIENYHLNPLHQLEGIFYPLKAMVINDNI
ncbi:MAG: hypothetical protein MJB14_04450 [Spirochaetes bacterium]|nr:hypothetical protein [Spirochaetota bacterium]